MDPGIRSSLSTLIALRRNNADLYTKTLQVRLTTPVMWVFKKQGRYGRTLVPGFSHSFLMLVLSRVNRGFQGKSYSAGVVYSRCFSTRVLSRCGRVCFRRTSWTVLEITSARDDEPVPCLFPLLWCRRINLTRSPNTIQSNHANSCTIWCKRHGFRCCGLLPCHAN